MQNVSIEKYKKCKNQNILNTAKSQAETDSRNDPI